MRRRSRAARASSLAASALALLFAHCGTPSGVADVRAVADEGVASDTHTPDDDAAPGFDAASDAGPEADPDASMGTDVAPAADGDSAASSGCAVCARFANPRSQGRVDASELTEASGLVASRRTPGAWFAHNDSGDSARFFALNNAGVLRATFTVDGANANDWEDLAAAPCAPGEPCLVFADVGNNELTRETLSLYRVREPEVDLGDGAPADAVLPSERMRFRYPDRAHNCEALVASREGALFVLTKEPDGLTGVFSLGPFAPGATVTATRIAQLDFSRESSPLVTGADAHPCNPRVLVRTYAAVYQFSAADGAPLEAAFASAPVRMPTPSEAQGESIAWALDGRSYRTLSEGAAQPFFEARCAD